jgi:hypothetical protein
MKRFSNDSPLFRSRALAPARQSNPFGSSLLSNPLFKVGIIATVVIGFFGLILFSYLQADKDTVVAVVEPTIPNTRARPSDPEGMEIPHRDRLIYNRLSNTANDAERLPLPARVEGEDRIATRPVSLEDLGYEPVIQTQPSIPPAQQAAPIPMQPAIAGAATTTPPPTTSVLPTPQVKPADAGSQQIAAIIPVLQNMEEQKPEQRPASPVASIAPAAPVAPPVAKRETPIATAAPVSNGFRVQLASFRSDEEATKAWRSFQQQYSSLLGGISHNVEKADVAGRGTFHRLQTQAFADKNAADALCASLKKAGRDCLVVRR